MKVTLTDLEQRFLDKYIDSDKIHPGSQIYWDMVKKIMGSINAEHILGTALISERANELAERILFKIANVEADEFLEEMLSTPQPTLNTKALSMNSSLKDKVQTEMKIRSALASSEMPLSRKELSERTGLRLSSVCGRINEMVTNGSVVVVDTKWDKDSQRQVQTLGLNK